MVHSVTQSPRGGNQIIINNDDGSVAGYAHSNPTVREGQVVREGDVIGHSDGSGNVVPHLHHTYRPCPGCGKEDPLPICLRRAETGNRIRIRSQRVICRRHQSQCRNQSAQDEKGENMKDMRIIFIGLIGFTQIAATVMATASGSAASQGSAAADGSLTQLRQIGTNWRWPC